MHTYDTGHSNKSPCIMNLESDWRSYGRPYDLSSTITLFLLARRFSLYEMHSLIALTYAYLTLIMPTSSSQHILDRWSTKQQLIFHSISLLSVQNTTSISSLLLPSFFLSFFLSQIRKVTADLSTAGLNHSPTNSRPRLSPITDYLLLCFAFLLFSSLSILNFHPYSTSQSRSMSATFRQTPPTEVVSKVLRRAEVAKVKPQLIPTNPTPLSQNM